MTDRAGRIAWLGAALLVLLAAQQLLGLPGSSRLIRGFNNGLHGPWFALVTWCLVSFWVRLAGRRPSRATLALGWLLALGVAGLSEGLQVYSARNAEFVDVLLNMLGASAAIAFWGAQTGVLSWRRGVAIAAVLLAVSLAPLFHALAVLGYQSHLWPTLVRFDQPLAAMLYSSNSEVRPVDGSLIVRLADTRWPGVTLHEPIGDWRGFQSLVIELEPDQPLELSVSIRLGGPDQVYRSVAVDPGPQRLSLDVGSWFDVERERVTAVVIYSTRDHAGQVLGLRAVRLE